MKNLIHSLRMMLLTIVVLFMALSFIIIMISEKMSATWIGLWMGINICMIILAIFLIDPRILYRRFVPVLVCTASLLYVILKPILKLNTYINRVFRKCYKIRKMSGSLSQCYVDVQEVYDEYSGYADEE